MRLVLVGPMTGQADLGFTEFDAHRDLITELGHVVDSPADRDRQMRWVFEDGGRVSVTEDFDYEAAMTASLEAIEKADGIVLLPGFAHSDGAVRELNHAIKHSKQIWYVHDWEDTRPLRRIA